MTLVIVFAQRQLARSSRVFISTKVRVQHHDGLLHRSHMMKQVISIQRLHLGQVTLPHLSLSFGQQ